MELEGYLYLALLGVFIVGFIAQFRVQSIFKKYSQLHVNSGINATQAAQNMLRNGGCNTCVVPINGSLSDHYDPRNDTVGLSQQVYNSDSVAALAVSAHEIGHVMQYYENYTPIKIRNSILPVANFSSQFAPWIAVIGLIINSYPLVLIGAMLFGAVFLFQLVTLPLEFNASSRALEMLSVHGYIDLDEESGARKVLRAAAMTYVIATLASLLNMLRFIAIARRSDRR